MDGPTPTGPKEECPLHGRYAVEWQVAYLVEGKLELISHEFRSDEHEDGDLAYTLWRADQELTAAQVDDPDNDYFLVCRLLLPWQRPRA